METEFSKEIDLGLAKILVLANIINRKTEMCCFANDVAHCGYVEIKFMPDKKNYDKGIPVKFQCHYDEHFGGDSKDRLDEITRCIEVLEVALKEKQIPINMLHAVKEYVVTKYEI